MRFFPYPAGRRRWRTPAGPLRSTGATDRLPPPSVFGPRTAANRAAPCAPPRDGPSMEHRRMRVMSRTGPRVASKKNGGNGLGQNFVQRSEHLLQLVLLLVAHGAFPAQLLGHFESDIEGGEHRDFLS